MDGVRTRMRERYAAARIRETKFLLSFDLSRTNGRLIALLTVFLVLNFLDAVTTLVAIHLGPSFVELNPIASSLFRLNFPGFIAALALKYMPVIPLVYATFLSDSSRHPMAVRIVKVSAFVSLMAAVLFYLAVVGSNSLNLVHYYST